MEDCVSTDIKWELEYTPKSFRQTACRLCVIRRLWSSIPTDKRAVDSDKLTIKTSGLYRMLLTNLRKEGWARLADNKKFQFVRNCPPAGVRTKKASGQTCQLDDICPFCWVRNNVLEPFKRMEQAFFTDNGLKPDLPPVKLVSSMCQVRVMDRAYHVPMTAGEVFRDKLKILTASVINDRNHESSFVPKSQFLGGIVIQSIDFSKESPLGYRGGLFVVEKDAEVPFETLQLERHKCRSTELSRTQLMYAMVRVAPYPGGWIRRAEPSQVLDYLKAVHGVRMMSTYGRLRGSSQ